MSTDSPEQREILYTSIQIGILSVNKTFAGFPDATLTINEVPPGIRLTVYNPSTFLDHNNGDVRLQGTTVGKINDCKGTCLLENQASAHFGNLTGACELADNTSAYFEDIKQGSQIFFKSRYGKAANGCIFLSAQASSQSSSYPAERNNIFKVNPNFDSDLKKYLETNAFPDYMREIKYNGRTFILVRTDNVRDTNKKGVMLWEVTENSGNRSIRFIFGEPAERGDMTADLAARKANIQSGTLGTIDTEFDQTVYAQAKAALFREGEPAKQIPAAKTVLTERPPRKIPAPEFSGLQGRDRANLPAIEGTERADRRGLNLASSLDDLVGPDAVNRIIEAGIGPITPTRREALGSSAVVNHLTTQLSRNQSTQLRNQRGRNIGVNLLVKTAHLGYNGRIANSELLRRDSFAARLPGIAPFACLVSEPRMLASGQLAMVVEQSLTGAFIDDEDLTEEDHRRMLFQLLSIGQAYHNAGLGGVDYGKTQIYYLTEKMFGGETSPRRIILFDFGYTQELPVNEPQRLKQISDDLKTEAEVLKDFYLRYLPDSEKAYVQQLITDMISGRFKSFDEVTNFVDETGKFRKELEEINRQCR